MTIAVSLFFTTFVYVFLKAGQQLNVVRGHYWFVPLFSFGMAATEVYVIVAIATAGYSLAAVAGMGTGGSLGAVLAMYLHTRFLGERK
jgi:hypothetical protein